MRSTCPVCEYGLQSTPKRDQRGAVVYGCIRCGMFALAREAEEDIERPLAETPRFRPLLSHYIRRMQESESCPLVTWAACEEIFRACCLPSIKEQADNVIRWLGLNLSGPGARIKLTEDEHGGIIGTADGIGFRFIVDGLVNSEMISGPTPHSDVPLILATLTFRGWERYEELRLGAPSGRRAFMAMPFGNEQLETLYRNVFQPAVEETGFVLRRLDEPPKIGNIDNRLRVDIKACRFLVADVTHGNFGAYWEAGYAEGLGKLVIYTCEKATFDDSNTRPHFDINHHHTVFWSKDDDGRNCGEMLKATIRASIPEAKQE